MHHTQTHTLSRGLDVLKMINAPFTEPDPLKRFLFQPIYL